MLPIGIKPMVTGLRDMTIIRGHDISNWHLGVLKYQLKKTWQQHYATPYHKAYIDRIIKYGNHILEVSAGSGLACMSIKAMHPEKLVVASDIQDIVLQLLADRMSRENWDILVMKINGFNIPYKNKTFDIVASEGLVEHFDTEDSQSLIKEGLRVGKYYIYTVPTKAQLMKGGGYGDERRRTFEDYHKLTAEVADIVEEWGSEFYYGAVCKEKVHSPITVKFISEGPNIIAEAVEFNEFGFGQNRSEALADLQHAIAELYFTLEESKGRLGVDLQMVWKNLQQNIHKGDKMLKIKVGPLELDLDKGGLEELREKLKDAGAPQILSQEQWLSGASSLKRTGGIIPPRTGRDLSSIPRGSAGFARGRPAVRTVRARPTQPSQPKQEIKVEIDKLLDEEFQKVPELDAVFQDCLKDFPELIDIEIRVTRSTELGGMKGKLNNKPIIILCAPEQVWGKWTVLKPIIVHELCHGIDNADPDKIMQERSPKYWELWQKLQKEGLVKCKSLK